MSLILSSRSEPFGNKSVDCSCFEQFRTPEVPVCSFLCEVTEALHDHLPGLDHYAPSTAIPPAVTQMLLLGACKLNLLPYVVPLVLLYLVSNPLLYMVRSRRLQRLLPQNRLSLVENLSRLLGVHGCVRVPGEHRSLVGKDSGCGPFPFDLANDLLAHALLAGIANDRLLDGFEPAEFLFDAAFSETELCEVVGFAVDANSVVVFL